MKRYLPKYAQALDALTQGDLERLKRVLKTPVKDSQRAQLLCLKQLVKEAASWGQEEAVHHLLSLSPPPTIKRMGDRAMGPVLADAWVAAHEAGQHSFAACLLSRLPPLSGDALEDQLRDRFERAYEAHAWKAVGAVLDQGHQPDTSSCWQAMQWMDRGPNEQRADAQTVLRRLVKLMPATALSWAAITALKVGDDETFHRCLAQAPSAKVIEDRAALLQEAVRAGRQDLVEQVIQHTGSHDDGLTLVNLVLKPTIQLNQPGLAHALLDRQPKVIEFLHLREQWRETALVGWLMTHQWVDNHKQAVTMDDPAWHRMFARVCPPAHVQAVRESIEQRLRREDQSDERQRHLNRLALWVEPEVRERWFQDEPVTFAEAIAEHRAAQTLQTAHPAVAAARKPRVRA